MAKTPKPIRKQCKATKRKLQRVLVARCVSRRITFNPTLRIRKFFRSPLREFWVLTCSNRSWKKKVKVREFIIPGDVVHGISIPVL